LRERRKSVVTNSTAGNAANSSGRCTYIPTSSTTMLIAMLKVNITSRKKGGSGSTIMVSTRKMKTGAAKSLSFVGVKKRRQSSAARFIGLAT
jgi:hypothetical protein